MSVSVLVGGGRGQKKLRSEGIGAKKRPRGMQPKSSQRQLQQRVREWDNNSPCPEIKESESTRTRHEPSNLGMSGSPFPPSCRPRAREQGSPDRNAGMDRGTGTPPHAPACARAGSFNFGRFPFCIKKSVDI